MYNKRRAKKKKNEKEEIALKEDILNYLDQLQQQGKKTKHDRI